MGSILLQCALCDTAENPTRREGTEEQSLLLCCPQNYGKTTNLNHIYLLYYCPLYRIKRASGAFEEVTKIGAFLNSLFFSWSAGVSMCHWATYLVFRRDKNTDLPSESGAGPPCIHLCSLLLVPCEHQADRITLKNEQKWVCLPGVD